MGEKATYAVGILIMEIKNINSPQIDFAKKLDSNQHKTASSSGSTPPLSFKTAVNLPATKMTAVGLQAPTENGDISSIREESVSFEEKEAARNRIRRLHGRNYGRSLTLEMDQDPQAMFTTKWILIAILVAVLLGGLGITLLGKGEDVKIKERPTKAPKNGKGRKSK